MSRCLIVWLSIVVSFVVIKQTRGDQLSDKIGVVAAHLHRATIDGSNGSVRAATTSAGWDEGLLAANKQPTNAVVVTFQRKEGNTYDAINRMFMVNNVTLVTRQTIGVWTLTLPNQDVGGKSNGELATLVTSLASDCLNGFSHRAFQYDGLYDGVKVFAVSIEPGHESGDWKDILWAIVDGTSVGFSCTKKLEQTGQFAGGAIPEFNTRWFDVAEARRKSKDP
jgi:hypothetical protein